jgi:integrase
VYSARSVRGAIPKSKAKEGDSLQREQLPDWFKAVRQIGSPVISAYLQALLITGARREELAGLRWSDVDFQWRSFTIRDKVEGTRTIPLTPYLSNLLVALPRRNEWVFSSPTAATGRLTEPRIAHTKALVNAGLPHVSLHGLRRSFGTLCEWVEVPSGISAQIMGHKPSALAEKHYRRRPLDLLRKWHDMIEAWILEQAGIEFIPMKAGLTSVK